METKDTNDIEDLFKEYQLSLPAKLKEIENQWISFQHDMNEQTFTEFHRKIHSLCGSAGLYGVESVYQAANILQNYLIKIPAPFQITNEQKMEIEQLINDLMVSQTKI